MGLAPVRRSRREHAYLSATGAYRPSASDTENLRQRFLRCKPYKDDTTDSDLECVSRQINAIHPAEIAATTRVDEVEQVSIGNRLFKHPVDANFGGASDN